MEYTVARIISVAKNRERLCKQRESVDWNAWDKGCKTGYLRALREVLSLLEKVKEEPEPAEEAEEKPTESTPWKPTKGTEYYFLMTLTKNNNVETAVPIATVWQDSKADFMRYATGNCHPSQGDAAKHGRSFLTACSKRNEKYKKAYELGMYGNYSADVNA